MSLTLALGLVSQLALTAVPAGFAEADYRSWQQTRLDNLRKPDSWLSLIGLVWLESGRHSVGSGADRHYQLGGGPDALGTLDLHDDQVWFEPASGVEVKLDGAPISARTQLHSDAAGTPSKLEFGDTHFILIERGGKLGLRVKSTAAPVLTGFTGIDTYAYDPKWVVTADWLPFEHEQTLEIATIIGTIEPTPSHGKAQFSIDGQTFTLQPTTEGDALFFVFGDRTNGRETYGMARFLYAKLTADGRHVVLDFNRTYNPPCAFTPYATCPLPTPENRLDLAVTAGEKKYADAAH
jgi:hypothetical protein